jgi:hypothetical protein
MNAFWLVVQRSGENAVTVWVALAGGAACWLVIFLMLPKPMLIYVFGHELTHAVWTWIFGGRVKKFKATSKGGHVVVTTNNFVIALAPYFFPIYVVMIVGAFLVGHLIWNWRSYVPFFHLLIGAAYAFHVTLTFHILKTRQSDITEQGYFFSAVVIFLGNILVLMVGLPLLTGSADLSRVFADWFHASLGVIHRLRQLF